MTPPTWTNEVVEAVARAMHGREPRGKYYVPWEELGKHLPSAQEAWRSCALAALNVSQLVDVVDILSRLAEAADACDPTYEDSPGHLQALSNEARSLLSKVVQP